MCGAEKDGRMRSEAETRGVAVQDERANLAHANSSTQSSFDMGQEHNVPPSERKLIRRKSELPKEITTVHSIENYKRADDYLNAQPESAS